MILPGTRRRGAALVICVAALFIIWHTQVLSVLFQFSKSREAADIIPHTVPPEPDMVSEHTPSITADLSSARAPFISWPLRRLCTEQVEANAVVPGLVFLCDNNSGGPGNIRNYILTCVRYAIEAGATGLQIPRIRTRSASNKADLFKEYQPLDYMFSEAHFKTAMETSCPHIALFPANGEAGGLDAIPGVAAKAAREKLSPERMVRRVTPKEYGGTRGGCDQRDPNRHTDRFGHAFRKSMRELAADLGHAPTSWENPMLVRLSWGVLWDWPVMRDGPELAATFGGLLRIREDILGLADQIVQSMRELATSAAEKSGSARASDRDEGLERGGPNGVFLGVHLRTEEDALSQWPTYENQSNGYIYKAEKHKFRGGVAYLASGSEKETQRFSQDARARLDLKVRSKYDLVQGQELEKLKSLSWDQQALVDFAVLLESDYFVGVSPSSFSINVALKRHLQKEGLYTRPWKVATSDTRSWLVGWYSSYWDDWLFMFDGMWP
ncbi:hypothetical protein F5Y03DRAFT_252296 [Xylaria venustula]|nr:hypothetical protein F5Y03DRAFT_252296 [Xylaria venustula]